MTLKCFRCDIETANDSKFHVRFQPYLLNSVVDGAAYVPALSHYQTHTRHGPTFRQIRATRSDWFDPTIPAFQTTLYAPAVHHATHFGVLDGLARSFRQDIPLTSTVLAPAAGHVLNHALDIHPAVQTAVAYQTGLVHAPSVVGLGAQHLVPVVGDTGLSSVVSTRQLHSLVPAAALYGHSYGNAALYNVLKKA